MTRIENSIANSGKNFSLYDVRAPIDVEPPLTFVDYLNNPRVSDAIGATPGYSRCEVAVRFSMTLTGDWARSLKFKLADVVNTGVRTLLWAGDADWICNYGTSISCQTCPSSEQSWNLYAILQIKMADSTIPCTHSR